MTCSRPQRTATRPGLEPGTPLSVVRGANHCASPPHLDAVIANKNVKVRSSKSSENIQKEEGGSEYYFAVYLSTNK